LGLDGHSKYFENAAQHGRGNINSIRRREFWELSSKRKKRNGSPNVMKVKKSNKK
jgi:hypothetical protein